MPQTNLADAGNAFVLTAASMKGPQGGLDPERLQALAQAFGAETFVETGTYLGETAATAAGVFPTVHTIELCRDLYLRAVQRFGADSRVHVHEGDSAEIFDVLIPRLTGRAVFWLDGHYSEGITAKGRCNTPILDELRALARHGATDHVLLIDDIAFFQNRPTNPGAAPSLSGYPTVAVLREAVLEINPEYTFAVVGDLALALPPQRGASVSPFIQAITLSRLFESEDAEIDVIWEVEQAIACADAHERGVVAQWLAQSAPREPHGLGAHPRLWQGLTLLHVGAAGQAVEEFTQVLRLGLTHWRVWWYLAQAAHRAGQWAKAAEAVQSVLNAAPHFALPTDYQGYRRAETDSRPRTPAAAVPSQAVIALRRGASSAPLSEIYGFNQAERDKWMAAKAATVPAGARVLDVGAGTCPYRPLFAHCDHRAHDFMQYEGVKLGGTAQYGRIDYVSDVTSIPAPDGFFDVVLCTEVLEHVPEPIEALREMARLLRPGGRLLVSAPLGSGLHQLPFHFYGGYTPGWYQKFGTAFGLDVREILPNGGFFKHLAQECARVAWTLPEHAHLHGAGVADIQKLFGEDLPRFLFALDERHPMPGFTVGYHVEAVKSRDAASIQACIDQDCGSVPLYAEAALACLASADSAAAFRYYEDACEIDADHASLANLHFHFQTTGGGK